MWTSLLLIAYSNLLVVTIFLLQIWWGREMVRAQYFPLQMKEENNTISHSPKYEVQKFKFKEKTLQPNYNQIFKFHNCSFKESSSASAQYVALQKKNWMKKSQNMPVWLCKTVLSCNFCTGC